MVSLSTYSTYTVHTGIAYGRYPYIPDAGILPYRCRVDQISIGIFLISRLMTSYSFVLDAVAVVRKKLD
jgi:hypothetical protein